MSSSLLPFCFHSNNNIWIIFWRDSKNWSLKAQNILFLLHPKIKKPSFPISHHNCRSQVLNPSLYLNKDNRLPTAISPKTLLNPSKTLLHQPSQGSGPPTENPSGNLAEPSTHAPLSVLQIMEICLFLKNLSFDSLCHFSHTASAESVSKSKKEETGRFLLEISHSRSAFWLWHLGGS